MNLPRPHLTAQHVSLLLLSIGAASLVAGVWLLSNLGAALVVLGVLLIAAELLVGR